MTTAHDVASNILNLTDDEFFSIETINLKQRKRDLLFSDFLGIAVNMPSQVNLDTMDSLFILLANRCTGDRDWEVPLTENCILAATNLTTGSVQFANALMTEKFIESQGFNTSQAQATKPSPEQLEGEGVSLIPVNVRTKIKLPPIPGTWSFTILHYDERSNASQVEFTSIEFPPAATQQPLSPRPEPNDVTRLPSYEACPQSPVMSDIGAQFIIEETLSSKKARWVVRGTLRITYEKQYLAAIHNGHILNNGSVASIVAVVPVTFAILTKGSVVPQHLRWNVPIYGGTHTIDDIMEGFFNINISHLIMNLPSNVYMCYLLINGNTYGPSTLSL